VLTQWVSWHWIEDQLLAALTPEEKVALRKLLTRALEGLARVPVASPKA